MEPTPLHLLIAEDEVAHAAAIRRAFENGGPPVQIEVVGTLREFRQRSAEQPPDLALLDLNLPDGRAVEVLSRPPEAGPFPVMVMTSYGNEQVAVEAIKAGALDYVVKSAEAFATMPRTVERALRDWNLLTERREAVAAQQRLIVQLEEALANVKTLSGLLPICSACKKIRDDQGYWSQVEGFIQDHTDARFTHSYCPDCAKKYLAKLDRGDPGTP
jgi:DNA-binding NtrC family response regulator